MPPEPELFDAYRRTSFTADTPFGVCQIRVGETVSCVDRLLEAYGEHEWTYITAWNPGSFPASAAENERRNAALECQLAGLGLRYWRGLGVPDDPVWPPEASFLVIGIDEPAAVVLGRRFGQAAIVVGAVGARARLVACGPR